jgi:hypothetical protein
MTPSVVRQLHASLLSRAPDQAIAILQEAGYAAGEGLYREFAAANNLSDLDADDLHVFEDGCHDGFLVW